KRRQMNNESLISAIVPASERFDETGSLAQDYLDALKRTGREFELVFIIDSRHKLLAQRLLELSAEERRLRVIQLAKGFGEATAISAGIESTDGDILVTLPAYYQVEPDEISKLLGELGTCDMAIAVRWPRAAASKFEVFRRKAFH